MLKCFLIIMLCLIASCSRDNDFSNNNASRYYQYQPPQNFRGYNQQYYQPNSRAYSNPYALPQQYATPYYDSDQYYVAPTNYYNIESNQTSPANNKY
ncbi:MAG: hypothetical protein ACKO6C_05370 [Alphaproteobacteria bacterium]